MIKALMARLRQGYKTVDFPNQLPNISDRFAGLPKVDGAKCEPNCRMCVSVCPTEAITRLNTGIGLDLGRCIFCLNCQKVCRKQAIAFTTDYRLAARKKEDLLIGQRELKLVEALDEKTKKLFGRSLKLRQVSAGGCNACEADTNVLGTLVFDLGRFGIQFVASPRHADGLLITGPVTNNMHLALQKTYDAVAQPKLTIAVGACAITGGLYRGHTEVHNGADAVIPIDLYIPGCPPHPLTILDGLLRLLDRIK
jgi:Ni,Fe-hydrogenase III small subunit/Pyruvate/2-oxoacid:ferredoxin oxidoreductase delta subunit